MNTFGYVITIYLIQFVALCSCTIMCTLHIPTCIRVCSTKESRSSLWWVCIHWQLQKSQNNRVQQKKRKALSGNLSLISFFFKTFSTCHSNCFIWTNGKLILSWNLRSLFFKNKESHLIWFEFISEINIYSCILILICFLALTVCLWPTSCHGKKGKRACFLLK